MQIVDNRDFGNGPRDEVIVTVETTNSGDGRGDIADYSFTAFASFEPDTWDGIDPERAFDAAGAIASGASIVDRAGTFAASTSLDLFTGVPSPGAFGLAACSLVFAGRRRR